MARETSAAAEGREIDIRLPKVLGFLLEPHPYKIAYGGRGGAKTESFARALVAIAASRRVRILCAREHQNSIAESVHATLSGLIEELGLSGLFEIIKDKISCPMTGSEFLFHGLHGWSVDSIKSMAKLDIVWVEEGQRVPKRSWTVLLPTMRADGCEVWVSFNPDMDSDDTWDRFVVHPPDGAVVAKVNWRDNPYFPSSLEKQRQHCLKHYPDEYDNIWEGIPNSVAAGAIYAREIVQMIEERRIRPTPYDPRLPVHTVWDLGWNDAMSIIMVQKPTPSCLTVINYMEDSFRRYDEYVADMKFLRYNWGTDWLPHDGNHGDPKTGKSAKQILQGLGRKVRIIPRSDPEARIKAARMMFPRIYIDDGARECDTGFLGAARLVDCLKRYRRNVPKTTGEPAGPVHDEYSHACDAFGGLAEIVDQIRNEGEQVFERLPGYRNPDSSMGTLG